MRTRSELRTRLRFRLGESSNFYTDAELDEALNNGAIDASERAEHLNRVTAITLRTETIFYALPEDSIKVPYRAWHSSPNEPVEMTTLERLSADQPRWWDSTGSFTEAVFPFGIGVIGVWPKPSAEGGILYVEGPRSARKMEIDQDIVEMPIDYEDALYLFSMFWLKLAEDDVDFLAGLESLEKYSKMIGGSLARVEESDSLRARAGRRTRDIRRSSGAVLHVR